MRRIGSIFFALLLIAGCGDDQGQVLTIPTTEPVVTESTDADPTPTTAVATSTTTAGSSTTATLPPTTAATTTTAAGPTAADALAVFFAAAIDLDDRIGDAAALFNAQWDAATATVGPGARNAIAALDAQPLKRLIPAGLSTDLEVAVLAVFADLDSRIAALDGGARYAGDSEFALTCLGYGGESFDRFDDDLATAQSLAGLEPPPTAPADSPAAGILEVRLTAIHSMNWGCDSCGGVAYTAPYDVDWAGRSLLGGVGFDATFNGVYWEILIYAC